MTIRTSHGAVTSIESPLLLVGDRPSNLRDTAKRLTEFVQGAKRSLHIAIYDFRLNDKDSLEFVKALQDKGSQGADVRIAYDHRNPPKTDSRTGSKQFGIGDDPAPRGTHTYLPSKFPKGSGVHLQPIGLGDSISTESIAGSKLMHSKYIIRDGGSPDAAVLMGSANFTDDAWAHQDNNVLVLHSPQLAAYYETDFNELWTSANISGTGVNDFGTIAQAGLSADIAFSPGEGKRIDGEIADMIRGAKRSLHVASMVLTSDDILNALSEVIEADRVPVHGIYDGPEMASAKAQMAKSARSATKLQQIQQLEKVLVAKASNPYTEKGIHNFMHNKLVVADDEVLTGSHNFSTSAEHNAENAIRIRSADIATQYRDYVMQLVETWGSTGKERGR